MATLYELALLADDVYNEKSDGSEPDGMYQPFYPVLQPQWRGLLDSKNLLQKWLPNHAIEWENGFFARLYGNLITHQTVIAFRGTLLSKYGDDISDVQLTLKHDSTEDENARQFYQACLTFLSSPTNHLPTTIHPHAFSKCPIACGHSLGGYLAQVLAVDYHVKAVSFNAPSIGHYQDPYRGSISSYEPIYNQLIYNFVLDSEFIHRVGSPAGQQYLLHDAISPLDSFDMATLFSLRKSYILNNLASGLYYNHRMDHVIEVLTHEYPILAQQRYG